MAERIGMCCVCGKQATSWCSGCHKRAYCGREDQLKDWKNGHKRQCQLLSSGDGTKEYIETPVSSSCFPKVTPLYPPERFSSMLSFVPDSWRFSGNRLRNVGNTCFANSVLQVLAYTRPLSLWLQSKQHSKRCRLQRDTCWVCKMESIVCELADTSSGTERIIIPREIVVSLHLLDLEYSYQQDSHQFFIGLIQGMQQSLLAQHKQLLPRQDETTFIAQLLSGYERSSLRCVSGCIKEGKGETLTPFFGLNVQLRDSIEESLESFTEIEVLDDWRCSMCGKLSGKRQLTIQQAPRVLDIQLKRFKMDGTKLTKHCIFGPDLVIDRVMAPGATAPPPYTLYAVITHFGQSIHDGHFVAFVRVKADWYLLDDEKAAIVPREIVFRQQAFHLFYCFEPNSGQVASRLPQVEVPARVASPSEDAWPQQVRNVWQEINAWHDRARSHAADNSRNTTRGGGSGGGGSTKRQEKIPRNAACPCGSGKKYKVCHMNI